MYRSALQQLLQVLITICSRVRNANFLRDPNLIREYQFRPKMAKTD